MTWDGLALKLEFERPLTDEEFQQLDRLIDAWLLVGVRRGYGRASPIGKGKVHNVYGEELGHTTEPAYLCWKIDMGSASERALETLVRCFKGLKQDDAIPIDRLVIGKDNEPSPGPPGVVIVIKADAPAEHTLGAFSVASWARPRFRRIRCSPARPPWRCLSS